MRYDRNGIFSEHEMKKLHKARVCVVGCGGIGGYIIEMFARVGVGHMTLIDGDTFNDTNLNRQLLSTENNLGSYKVDIAKERVRQINSTVDIKLINQYLLEDNAAEMINGFDLVMDGLDSINGRRLLQNICEKQNIPMVHGAIAGWYGQVSVIFPGDRTIDMIYGDYPGEGIEKTLGNPSFTPATIASIQVSEGIKVLLDREHTTRGKLLLIDLLTNEYQMIDLIPSH